jgi:hypothetical protein
VKAIRILALASLLAPTLGALGCEAILGIEDARLDRILSADGAAPGTGGDHGAGGDSGVGGGGSDLCASYCGAVMASCTGAFAVYTTVDSCLAVCSHLPEGLEGDENDNSVHCRLRHAESAPAEPLYYCPIAGPGGNGVCGSNCDGLCSVAQGVCTGDLGLWASIADCHDDCEDVSDLGTYSTDPDAAMYQGDHVQCWLYHLSSAAVTDPDIHCPHAAGAPPCAKDD